MSTLADLIDSLAEDGFVLTEDNGRLRCTGAGRQLDEARASSSTSARTSWCATSGSGGRRRLTTPITPADRSGRLPLSLQQQRLWPVKTMAGGETGAYHIPLPCSGSGAGSTFRPCPRPSTGCRRHEILRTVFDEEGGRPYQRVLPPAPLGLEIRDVSADGLEEAVRVEATRPFDLAQGPLLRAVVLRVGPDDIDSSSSSII